MKGVKMIFIVIILALIGILGYLVIVGGNMCETEEERRIEDEEQIKYLSNYKKNNQKRS